MVFCNGNGSPSSDPLHHRLPGSRSNNEDGRLASVPRPRRHGHRYPLPDKSPQSRAESSRPDYLYDQRDTFRNCRSNVGSKKGNRGFARV